jgi:flavin reductase (DIM6/NTAB) family NADH-FMN oxidoreductase RutF
MRMPLPPALKRRIGALPQWSSVALRQPQEAVSIRLRGDGEEVDVTRAAVVAALQPLTLGIGLDENARSRLGACSVPALRFVDVGSQRTVGTLQLVRIRDSTTREAAITLFEVADAAQHCLEWPYRSWNEYLQNRAIRKHRRPGYFWLSPAVVQQLMIFYICPRQVVLVSVEEGEHRNMFPMDLIGPVAPDRFTLALRNSSQSVPAMKLGRRVALADVAAADCALAFRLGARHRDPLPDWQSLPCPVARSREYSLPYAQSALHVRELAILDHETIGSHTLFVCRLAGEQSLGEADQLHQTSGIYQHFRMRHGYPFPAAARAVAP